MPGYWTRRALREHRMSACGYGMGTVCNERWIERSHCLLQVRLGRAESFRAKSFRDLASFFIRGAAAYPRSLRRARSRQTTISPEPTIRAAPSQV